MPDSGGDGEGLTPGQVFAGYTIVRRLGAGGMGQVYLARHPRLPRRDALKVLSGELTANDEFRQRFNREADLAASLYHEHIVGIHDRGEFEGKLWLSMDYVEGIDVSELLRSRYPSGMPKVEVIEVISAVADALDYAHSRGLLHRDVKPANILLGSSSPANPRRRIVLADFGIARELGEISGLTATNMLVGTTAYCAPEQLQGADLDAQADQYALGCTAYNLLTGSAPFHSTNPAVVIGQHLSAPPPLISQRRPDLAELDPVIARALAKHPSERYASCADFAAALAGRADTAPPEAVGATDIISAPTEVIATPPTPEVAAPPTRGGRVGAVALVVVLVAAALVAVAAVIGIRLLNGHDDRPEPGASAPTTRTTANTVAPPPKPALRLSSQITDQSGVLGPLEHNTVERALNNLHTRRGVRLWVVYVKDFAGLKPFRWAEDTMRVNGFTDTDALLAVATEERAFSFRVPRAAISGTAIDVEAIRRDRIEPAVARREWTRAAVAAANGLDVMPG
ncbi:serine/threonine-protein kinase [Mycobacterium colombiense]|uniref:non-specific serine/threonine protein kinase n=1 Tax=Mycobacterium colombiense TaxID=339268 RepID=A0A1A2YK42_9MYCO|nr:serine/threonine-protein kinase [Mycobacterium colombiense]OBI38330.1 serine/threonine protein kinase [Mycobacterium colombiense]